MLKFDNLLSPSDVGPHAVVVEGGGGGDVRILDMSVLHAQSGALAFWTKVGGVKLI